MPAIDNKEMGTVAPAFFLEKSIDSLRQECRGVFGGSLVYSLVSQFAASIVGAVYAFYFAVHRLVPESDPVPLERVVLSILLAVVCMLSTWSITSAMRALPRWYFSRLPGVQLAHLLFYGVDELATAVREARGKLSLPSRGFRSPKTMGERVMWLSYSMGFAAPQFPNVHRIGAGIDVVRISNTIRLPFRIRQRTVVIAFGAYVAIQFAANMLIFENVFAIARHSILGFLCFALLSAVITVLAAGQLEAHSAAAAYFRMLTDKWAWEP